VSRKPETADPANELAATLAVAKELKAAFGRRGVDQHGSERAVRVISQGDSRVILAFDLSLSRKVLVSPHFANPDYFSAGLQRMAASGRSVHWMRAFFEASPHFMEGADHRDVKKAFHRVLEDLSVFLETQRPRISAYFRKRAGAIHDPLVFSRRFVRLVTGLQIRHLTGLPLRRVYRSFDRRRNVFGLHFMPARHAASEAAFEHLFGDLPPRRAEGRPDPRDLLAQGLLIMGVDPMLGTLTASLAGRRGGSLADGVFRHCPTSYVSRTCMTATTVGDVDFFPGDVVYTALVPSRDEADEPTGPSRSLAFGVGLHTCSGKRLTLQMLDMAEAVVAESFPEGFAVQPRLSPDGAFLAFRSAG